MHRCRRARHGAPFSPSDVVFRHGVPPGFSLRAQATAECRWRHGEFLGQLIEFVNSGLHEAFMSFVRGQFALPQISSRSLWQSEFSDTLRRYRRRQLLITRTFAFLVTKSQERESESESERERESKRVTE